MDKNEFSNGEQYFLAPGERVEVTAEELASQRRTPQLVKELVENLYRDKVDLKHFIQAYQLIQDNHITVIGTRRVPSETGRQLIIKLYDTIEPYRSLLLETNDHGPYPAREVYVLRCAMVDIIRMYDEYCVAIRDLIVPPTPQQSPTPSSSVNVDLETKTLKSNATAKNDEAKGKKKEIFHIDNIDVEELSGYFKSQFRGMGGHFDYFSRLVEDMKQLTTQKEMGMLAVMIRRSPYYIKKHATFASWLRAFCKIVNQPCPRDMHPNKYDPSELMRVNFSYLHYDNKVD